jgi:phosphoglycerol transferase MdoB-like AlkP superfamily enzyme
MKIIKLYVKSIFFWLVIFLLCRLFFIAFLFDFFQKEKNSDVLQCFVYGFGMDLSQACYFSLLSVIMGYSYISTGIKAIANLHNFLIKILFVVTFILNFADLLIYPHWNTKISVNALRFLTNPMEIYASTSFYERTISLLIIVMLCYFIYRYNKLFPLILNMEVDFIPKERIQSFFIFISISILSIIGMRGGVGVAPINQSNAFFSNSAILNHGALNTIWNLFSTILNDNNKEKYNFYSEDRLKKWMQNAFNFQKDSTTIFDEKISKPNIVFIILEGIGTDVVGSFGGIKGCTPTIDALKSQGLSFRSFYANGDRTFKGLPALLSGFPTQPVGSIMTNPDNTLQLPGIAKSLSRLDYSSSFYYGGESSFANIKTYLLNTGFQKVIDIHDFPKSFRGLKWGVSDHFMFDALAEDIKNSKEPFFKSILTLSSHEPYDIPFAPKFAGKNDVEKYKSSVFYTDSSLYNFIKKIADYPQTQNTIFVLTSDHGNVLPMQYKLVYKKQKFHIPMIIFGKPLLQKFKGKESFEIASQNDLVASILSVLKIENKEYLYSQNLFNNQFKNFAFYTFEDGFGYIDAKESFVYDNFGKAIIDSNGVVNNNLLQFGKAIMQHTYKKSLNIAK